MHLTFWIGSAIYKEICAQSPKLVGDQRRKCKEIATGKLHVIN